MGYNVVATAAFEESLDAALGYLEDELNAYSAAKRLMRRIAEIAGILESTPFINAISTKPFLSNRELREHFFMGYVIVYKVHADSVTFVNFFHQTQDYDREDYWRE